MTDSTTQALLPHLDVMDRLDLDERTLSAQNLIILHEAVERLTNPQGLTVNDINGDQWPKYWELYEHQPDDDVMQILQLPPGKIKELNIRSVRMTDSMTQALLPHLDVMDWLDLDERTLSAQNLIILHEAVERLTNPQGLTVNRINGDRWPKYWEMYEDQPDDDVMQILQLPPGKIKELDIELVRMTDSMTQALLPHIDVMDWLHLDEVNLSTQNLIILHEAVERLTNPQGLTVNDINGDRWPKYWELYKDQPYDDVMQILQLPPGKIKELNIISVWMIDSMTQALLPHLDVMDKLDLDEKKLSTQNLIILHEAVERLTNPQGLTVNDINGDQWSKYWKVYGYQPDDDVMQILQLPPGKIKVLDIKGVPMSNSTTQALLPHLDVMDKLYLDEERLSLQNRIILHEAVERLTNPQDLTVNDINGDRWSKYWELYWDQPDDDVMQILQLPPGKIKGLYIKRVRMTDSTTQALLPHLDVMEKLDLDEEKLSAQNRIILHEAVERLTNPQGLTVNGINGDRWPKYWGLYEHQPDDDVMQILQFPPGKIKGLDISGVRMTDSTTQALLPHLDVMDKLRLVSLSNDINLNLYMEDISRKIMDRQNKIQLGIVAPLDENATHWLVRCLSNVSDLTINEEILSLQNLIILHEAVERLTNPQGLTVNRINGDRWSKYWVLHEYQPYDDVMQILQLPLGKIKELNIPGVRMTDSMTQALLPHLDVMDRLGLESEYNDMNLNLYMEDISRKIMDRQNKIQIYIHAPLDENATHWLACCLSNVNDLTITEWKLSAQKRIILHEAVERLTNPQGLTVNDINGDRWSKYWELYWDQPYDDVMQILQLPPGKIKVLDILNMRMTDSTTLALLPHLDVMDWLDLDEGKLSLQNLIILHEAVERLTNPQGLTVNGINGDRWSKYWESYYGQPDDDVMQILQLPPGKIKGLDIFDVPMTDSTTQALLPHLDVMDKLDLDEKELSAQNLIILHEAVERLTNPQGLTVNGINGDRWSKDWELYEDQPVDDVMQILQLPPGKIKGLDIEGVWMTDSTTQALLPHLDVMDKLDLNERKLSVQYRIILREAVERLTNPQGLTVNRINGDRWPKYWELYKDQPDDYVMQILQLPPEKIKELNIIAVRMTDSMTQALLPHLDVMDKLDLDEGKLSAQNRIILHEVVERLTNPQGLTVNGINGDRWPKYWGLYCDQPDDDVMQILQFPPGKIKELNIRGVRMTDSMTQALLPHLDVMNKLDLDEEKLSAQNLIILHEAVERLTNPQGLTVNDINGDRWPKCWKSYYGQPDDVMQILQLPPGKIKELNIRGVRMTDSMTQALLPHLDVMDKLDLDEKKLSAQIRIILHEAVERLTNPQGLTVNDINGDRWSKYWELYEDQPNDDVMQILQLPPGKIKGLYIKRVWMTDSTTQALLPHLDVMDKLRLESWSNDMNLNLYMEDISWKIMNRQNKIQLGIDATLDENATHWLARCLSNVSDLTIDERKLSAQNCIILHEAVEQLTNPQGLTVNRINGDRWPKYWGLYYDQPDDDVMQILQLPPGKIKVLYIKVGMTDSTTQALLPHLDVMDKLRLESRYNDIKLNLYMEDISRKIMDRQNKIEISILGAATEHVRPLFRCLHKISNLQLDRKYLSSDNYRLLEEAKLQHPSLQVQQILLV
ncbi:uncharacterized protein LOC108950780 [Ciona intestinalis]